MDNHELAAGMSSGSGTAAGKPEAREGTIAASPAGPTLTKKAAIKWGIATMLTPLAIGLFLANGYLAGWYAATGYQGSLPPSVILQGMSYTAGPALWLTVALWWRLNRKAGRFRDLFGARTKSLVTDLALGAGLGAAWVAIYGLMGYPPFAKMFVLDMAKAASLPASLSAGFCEEFLFRGFLFLVIARAGGSTRAQVVWAALAFGAAHVHWGPGGMFFTVLLGLSFGWLRARRGGVWPAVAAHSLLNLCVEPGLLETAFSLGG